MVEKAGDGAGAMQAATATPLTAAGVIAMMSAHFPSSHPEVISARPVPVPDARLRHPRKRGTRCPVRPSRAAQAPEAITSLKACVISVKIG